MTPDERRVMWVERAAIMEYDGGLERAEAERRATQIMLADLAAEDAECRANPDEVA